MALSYLEIGVIFADIAHKPKFSFYNKHTVLNEEYHICIVETESADFNLSFILWTISRHLCRGRADKPGGLKGRCSSTKAFQEKV